MVYLPKTVTRFKVDSFQMDNKKIRDNASNDSNNRNTEFNTTFNYNQIKELSLNKYFPVTDKEILYIMERYTV